MKRQHPFIVLTALATLLGLGACSEEKTEAKPSEQRPVLMAAANAHPSFTLTFPGTIEPQVATQKAFRVPGQVISKNVAVGDSVRKGDVLAVLDRSQLQQGLQSAEANVASARSQLNNALAVNDRAKALAKEGFASAAQIDNAAQSLAAANANVDSAEAQLDKAREQLDYAQLTADYDGIVTSVQIEVGETVAAGAPAITVARPDVRDAVIDIPEDGLSLVKQGDGFKVATLLQPEIMIDGKVREIAPSADQQTHTVRIKISIGNTPENFRIGTTISATADKTGTSAVTIPGSAVFEDSGKSYVWRFDPATSIVTKTAIGGRAAGQGLLTVESGLKGGDLVAVAGVHSLKDGEKVVRAEGVAQ